MMRYLHWLLRIVLFVLLLGFAIKNTDPVVVRYFLRWEWHAPLSLVLLLFFIAGAVLGLAGGAGWAFRERRELLRLRSQVRNAPVAAEAPVGEPERLL